MRRSAAISTTREERPARSRCRRQPNRPSRITHYKEDHEKHQSITTIMTALRAALAMTAFATLAASNSKHLGGEGLKDRPFEITLSADGRPRALRRRPRTVPGRKRAAPPQSRGPRAGPPKIIKEGDHYAKEAVYKKGVPPDGPPTNKVGRRKEVALTGLRRSGLAAPVHSWAAAAFSVLLEPARSPSDNRLRSGAGAEDQHRLRARLRSPRGIRAWPSRHLDRAGIVASSFPHLLQRRADVVEGLRRRLAVPSPNRPTWPVHGGSIRAPSGRLHRQSGGFARASTHAFPPRSRGVPLESHRGRWPAPGSRAGDALGCRNKGLSTLGSRDFVGRIACGIKRTAPEPQPCEYGPARIEIRMMDNLRSVTLLPQV